MENLAALIEKQAAEIARLKAEIEVHKGWEKILETEGCAPVIRKALEEFADRLESRADINYYSEKYMTVSVEQIDEVLKEMKGQ